MSERNAFPPGEGIAFPYPCKHQFIGQLRKTNMHIEKLDAGSSSEMKETHSCPQTFHKSQ